MFPLGEDEVIQQLNSQEPAGGLQLLGDHFVRLARSHISRRVIVGDDHGRSAIGDMIGEDLPGMDVDAVGKTDGDGADGEDFISSGKGDAKEVLLFVGDTMADIRKHLGRPGDPETLRVNAPPGKLHGSGDSGRFGQPYSADLQ